MSERAPYSRVYWTVVDDPKFAEVYDDDRALACWLRLLIVADQAWPASAPLPATARKTAVALLVRVGLVDPQPGGRYRIHGLDAERGTRRLSATRNRLGQDPDGPQQGPNRGPDGLSTPGRSLAEPSRATPSLAEPGARDPADAYWNLTGKYPTDDVLAWIDDLTEQYGSETVIGNLCARHAEDRSTKTLLGRVKTGLQRDARRLDLAERQAEQARIVELRKPTVLRRMPEPEISDEEADREAAEFLAKSKAGAFG